ADLPALSDADLDSADASAVAGEPEGRIEGRGVDEGVSSLASQPSPLSEFCPVCKSPRSGAQASCPDCGYHFAVADAPPSVGVLNRCEPREQTGERQGVQRFRGRDHGDGKGIAVPFFIIRQPETPASDIPIAEEVVPAEEIDEAILPDFDALEG